MRLTSGRTAGDAGSAGAGGAGPVRKEEMGRNRTLRAAEATGKKSFTRPGKTVTRSKASGF